MCVSDPEYNEADEDEIGKPRVSLGKCYSNVVINNPLISSVITYDTSFGTRQSEMFITRLSEILHFDCINNVHSANTTFTFAHLPDVFYAK